MANAGRPTGSLAAFLVASWLGASIEDAVQWGLIVVTLELLSMTYVASSRAGVSRGRRFLSALVGLALGVAVISLKTLLH